MHMRSLALWPAAGMLSGALADNLFINPPPMGKHHDYSANQQYKVGQVLKISWETEITTGVGVAVNFPLDHEENGVFTILNLTSP